MLTAWHEIVADAHWRVPLLQTSRHDLMTVIDRFMMCIIDALATVSDVQHFLARSGIQGRRS